MECQHCKYWVEDAPDEALGYCRNSRHGGRTRFNDSCANYSRRLTPLAPDAEQRRALGEQENGAGEASR
jgi:hypothetical protein